MKYDASHSILVFLRQQSYFQVGQIPPHGCNGDKTELFSQIFTYPSNLDDKFSSMNPQFTSFNLSLIEPNFSQSTEQIPTQTAWESQSDFFLMGGNRTLSHLSGSRPENKEHLNYKASYHINKYSLSLNLMLCKYEQYIFLIGYLLHIVSNLKCLGLK